MPMVKKEIKNEGVDEINEIDSSNAIGMPINEMKLETNENVAESNAAESDQPEIDEDETFIQNLLGFYLN